MTDFVICIDDDWGPAEQELVTVYNGKVPKKGIVYTIRDVLMSDQHVGYRLEEIVNPLVCYGYSMEPTFSADQFRPVKDSDLDIFREMLNDDSSVDREVITTH